MKIENNEARVIRLYNGRAAPFRLPTAEEVRAAENAALDKKSADEDFNPYD